jgi:flagellar biosynthetic protein FlhB
MAEDDQDQSQKTEEPTQRRLDEAREKGQVASSREVGHWAILAGGAVAIAATAQASAAELIRALAGVLEGAATIAVDPAGLSALFTAMALDAGLALAPVLGLLVLAAVASGFVQHGFVFSTETIQPQLDRLSPLKGVERIFSLRAMVELAKGMAKIALVAAVAGMVMWPEAGRLINAITLDPEQAVGLLDELSRQLLIATAAVMTVVAGADLLFQKLQHHRKLRMSRQELKDEFKQSEGDPMVKARLRQLRNERSRKRMMAAVPTADVVLTNPTHFAVALKYEMGVMPAPKVVAKGADRIAAKIREVAKEAGVPIVENPPLARALHDAVDLDGFVPEQHFRAVAEVIGYVMRLKGKMPTRRPRPPGAPGTAAQG